MAYGQTPIAKGALVRIQGSRIVQTFPFQFNPTETSYDIGVDWFLTDSPGQYLPVAVFSKFQPIKRAFELLLYGRESRSQKGHSFNVDVETQIAQLEMFCSPGSDFGESAPQFVAPSGAKLVQGDRVWNGVVENIKFTEQTYNRRYNVVIARAAVSFVVTSQGYQQELAYIDRIRAKAGAV